MNYIEHVLEISYIHFLNYHTNNEKLLLFILDATRPWKINYLTFTLY